MTPADRANALNIQFMLANPPLTMRRETELIVLAITEAEDAARAEEREAIATRLDEESKVAKEVRSHAAQLVLKQLAEWVRARGKR